ncbi:MAG: hypothetical protein FWF47_03545 [Clostridia bacterium]|nr:hypothetical protein [Clostridia bacterium]
MRHTKKIIMALTALFMSMTVMMPLQGMVHAQEEHFSGTLYHVSFEDTDGNLLFKMPVISGTDLTPVADRLAAELLKEVAWESSASPLDDIREDTVFRAAPPDDTETLSLDIKGITNSEPSKEGTLSASDQQVVMISLPVSPSADGQILELAFTALMSTVVGYSPD